MFDIKVISIHAPAEGATNSFFSLSFRAIISIHAPAEGATWHGAQLHGQQKHFNPRSRGGSDEGRTSDCVRG